MLFLIHLASLCLLSWDINLFTSVVIIDKEWLQLNCSLYAIYLIAFLFLDSSIMTFFCVRYFLVDYVDSLLFFFNICVYIYTYIVIFLFALRMIIKILIYKCLSWCLVSKIFKNIAPIELHLTPLCCYCSKIHLYVSCAF